MDICGSSSSIKQRKKLIVEHTRIGIDRLRKCLWYVQAFDPSQVTGRRDPKILDLEANIKQTLELALGPNSDTYRAYSQAASLDTVGHVNGYLALPVY
jgi:hypothetical protein